MDFVALTAHPLWKNACKFGKMLISLDQRDGTWGLQERAFRLLRVLTEGLLATTVTDSQPRLRTALEECRELEVALNRYFGAAAESERVQLTVFFRLEQVREQLFLEIQEDSLLCAAGA